MTPITAHNPASTSVLVVDDAPQILEVVGRTLGARGYEVLTAQSGDDALDLLDARTVDLVISDLKMPGNVGGMELLRLLHRHHPQSGVLIMTGYASVSGAVDSMQAGAEDYLEKPFTDHELSNAVERALGRSRLRSEGLGAEPIRQHAHGMIGGSQAMRAIFRKISKAATSQATVLLTGESGTGKELVARAIHDDGARASAPFVPINCAQLTESLLESELFGHVRGAFTGAATTRGGLFQAADGGCLFLDEIGDLSPALQAAFLRVLEDGEVRMVGASRSRTVDVRIIAATNKDLRAAVASGAFREDLFYRLNVIPIELPPVRTRDGDIPRLIQHFTDSVAEELERARPSFSSDSLELLYSYSWPGNVREIQNVVRQLLIMADGDTIELADLPAHILGRAPRRPRGLRPLSEVQSEHIRNVLTTVGGNKSRAARVLGIDRKTLRSKLEPLHYREPNRNAHGYR